MIRIRTARIDDAATLAAAERETARTPGLLRSLPHELRDEALQNALHNSKRQVFVVDISLQLTSPSIQSDTPSLNQCRSRNRRTCFD
jgi:predicted ATP-dependent serine protease